MTSQMLPGTDTGGEYFMRTRKILFMLISAITVLWAVPSFSAESITITSKLKAVIPNYVPKISAVNTEQNLKKGQPVDTITVNLDKCI